MKRQLTLAGCFVVSLTVAAVLLSRPAVGSTIGPSDRSSTGKQPLGGKTGSATGAGTEVGHTSRIAPQSEAQSGQTDEAALLGLSPFMRQQFAAGGMFEGHNPVSEIVERRSLKAKHFPGPGGTVIAVLTSTPVHYKSAEGSWLDIDTRIVPSAAGTHQFENTTNNVKSHFPTANLSGIGVSIGYDDDSAIKIGLHPSLIWTDEAGASTLVEASTAASPKTDDDAITYGNALPSADNQFIVHTDQLKNNVILKRVPAGVVGKSGALGYSEEIELPSGWYLSSGGHRIDRGTRLQGAIDVVDSTGKTVYAFPRPVVYDAASAPNTVTAKFAPGTFFSVSRAGKRMRVITMVPLSWLLSSERRFPVTIDPTVDFMNLASVGDWYNCPSCACPGCNPPISAPPLYEPSAMQTCSPYNSYNRDQQSDTGWFSFDVSSLRNACITQTLFKSLRGQMFGNPITCISALDIDLRSVLVQPGPTTTFGDALITGPILGTMHYGATACSLSFLDISGANADIKAAAKGGTLYTLGLATSESPGALSFVFGPILEITYLDQTISPSTLPGATVGVPYSVTLSTATGSSTYSTSGFPASITVSGSKLVGTPTAPGTFPVSVTSTDSATGCTNTINYTFVVSCATTLSPSTLPNGTTGTLYSVTFSGASGSPKWTATGLPTGLSMGLTTGVLSGTPTQSGTFSVIVDANDTSISCEIRTTYSLVIACPTITVTVPTIAAGTAGVAYTSVTFTQSGGTGTTTFTETGSLPTGMTFSTGGVLSGTPTQTGTFPFTVTATDSNGCTGSHAASITINCPTIVVTAPSIPAGTAGVAYGSVTFTQTAGVGTVAFTKAGALPTGMTFSTGGVLSGTPTQTGSFPFSVTATDSNGCTGTASASITVNCPTIVVTAPTISAGTAGVVFSPVTFTQTAGVGAIVFSETGALPNGMTLSTGGVLSGTPIQTGIFPFTVTATDSNGCTGTTTASITVSCPTITVSPTTIPSGTAGVGYNVTFSQTSGVGTVVLTESGTLPTGMTFSAGVLSGTPTQTGTFNISITATDSNACTGSRGYTLVINCPTIAIAPGTVPAGTAGVVYSTTTFTQTGGVGTIVFSESGALPPGITLTSGGVLSGTPTQTGSFPYTVTATDKNACTGSASYTLVINCPTITVSPGTIPADSAGVLRPSTTFTQTGGVGAIIFTESGALPAGMTFVAGVLSGTPTQIGSFPITVTATDKNNCSGSRGYTLVINCPTIIVSPSVISMGTAGVAYATTSFSQMGGVGAITFSETGALPTGLTFTSSGILSGTPLVIGSFPITVTATDKNGCIGMASYALVINCPTITVTPVSVPAAVQYVPYAPTQFKETGGVGAITYTTASALPTGMTLTAGGLLSGTPSQSGAYSIVVVATDANGCTGSATVVLAATPLNQCMRDDHSGYYVQFNSTTGDYLFTICGTGGFTMSGTGTLRVVNSIIAITDTKSDRSVSIQYNTASLTGRCTLHRILASGVNLSYTISDTNPHPVCSCGG